MGCINLGNENSTSLDLYDEYHGTGSSVALIHALPLSRRAREKHAGKRVGTAATYRAGVS